MTELNAQADVRPLPLAKNGVLAQAVTLGIDTTERALQSALELVEATRRELFHVVSGGLDWVETIQHSTIKIARETLGRLDKLSEQITTGVETTTLALTGTVRSSSELAGEMIAGTTESLIGKRSSPKAA
jgi:hypothetical protein